MTEFIKRAYYCRESDKAPGYWRKCYKKLAETNAALTKERDEANERSFGASEAHVMTMQKLAAAQATIAKLRDSIRDVAYDEEGYIMNPDLADLLDELPTSTTALDARLKEEREKVIEWIRNNYQDHTLDGICYAIKSMT